MQTNQNQAMTMYPLFFDPIYKRAHFEDGGKDGFGAVALALLDRVPSFAGGGNQDQFRGDGGWLVHISTPPFSWISAAQGA